MRANLDATNGLLFSQPVLLALIRSGMERDAAYRVVQEASTRALDSGRHLRDELTDHLEEHTLESVFSLEAALAAAPSSVDHLATISTDWLKDQPGW
jgi:adenylosuccinate lyase